ncbi:MAG TPA: hypothetical protein VNZ26_09765 [Vicinamibacterales bacterium]|nr:hypothetical protein [Vicinamibacterales bacterium]
MSLHAVYQFVRRRELQKQRPKIRRSQQQVARREPNVERPRSIPPPAPEDSSDAVRKRIAAIKAREAPLPTERKEFAFNENEPLQLINKHRKEPEDGRD